MTDSNTPDPELDFEMSDEEQRAVAREALGFNDPRYAVQMATDTLLLMRLTIAAFDNTGDAEKAGRLAEKMANTLESIDAASYAGIVADLCTRLARAQGMGALVNTPEAIHESHATARRLKEMGIQPRKG